MKRVLTILLCCIVCYIAWVTVHGCTTCKLPPPAQRYWQIQMRSRMDSLYKQRANSLKGEVRSENDTIIRY